MPLEAPGDFKRNRDRAPPPLDRETVRDHERIRGRMAEGADGRLKADAQSSNLRKLQICPFSVALTACYAVMSTIPRPASKLRSNKATNQPNERHADAGNAA